MKILFQLSKSNFHISLYSNHGANVYQEYITYITKYIEFLYFQYKQQIRFSIKSST